MAILDSLIKENDKKIVLLVMDGVGDIPDKDGRTPLSAANKPNMDSLARRSALGLTIPVDWGITPGSGPAHLALFGYDPVKYNIGRGVLEALGLGMEVRKQDLAARGNFCTLDENGVVIDRRGGAGKRRLSTEENQELIELLSSQIKRIEDVELIFRSGLEHRFAVIFRGRGLAEGLPDTDPHIIGEKIRFLRTDDTKLQKTARVINLLTHLANDILKEKKPANGILLRGFSCPPDIPPFQERFRLSPCAIASYPMYRGLASLVGMTLLPVGEEIESEFASLEENWEQYNFFFVHIKKTDSYGEDGNFEKKREVIEQTDRFIPRLLELSPDVLIITGDHSTPVALKNHSWHPVPYLLYSPFVRWQKDARFDEEHCLRGSLGIFPAEKSTNLMLAHSLKLDKYGA
ncbi:2,3-bisphosphoglycerate-independent phosphoglycerate mutase [bacterium]|nr:2,3-bisphosphoglycerate-independent phosphoglycerate mutase [bacterium]